MEKLQRKVNTPILILIGKNTSGAAELFTSLLIKYGKAMTLGGKTPGKPFHKEKILLSNGNYLLIPQIPAYLSAIEPVPIEPAITFDAYPQIKFKKLRQEAGSEINDTSIKRAIDLIICLNALSPVKK
jgi:C-terminal processing protease CtpA/Prc